MKVYLTQEQAQKSQPVDAAEIPCGGWIDSEVLKQGYWKTLGSYCNGGPDMVREDGESYDIELFPSKALRMLIVREMGKQKRD